MTRPNRARAPKGADGTCRNRRRPQGERRPKWVRPFIRATRAITSSARLIDSTVLEVAATECHVHRRPVRTSQNLHEASGRLVGVWIRLYQAARDLVRANEYMARDPEHSAEVPELLAETTRSWIEVAERLGEVVDDLVTFQRDVLHSLETGMLVPEPSPAGRRRRISLAPRPVPVRAFLRLRQPRVVDRIASILRRRRRTPRPRALSVPPETHQGRAPPLSSICPL